MKGILQAGIYGLYNWSKFAERYNRKGTLQIQENYLAEVTALEGSASTAMLKTN